MERFCFRCSTELYDPSAISLFIFLQCFVLLVHFFFFAEMVYMSLNPSVRLMKISRGR